MEYCSSRSRAKSITNPLEGEQRAAGSRRDWPTFDLTAQRYGVAFLSFSSSPSSLSSLLPPHHKSKEYITYYPFPSNTKMSKLPTIDQVPSLATEDRAAILDLLFEPSTQLHTLSVPLLHDEKFDSYDDLIAAVGMQLTDLSESASTSDTEWLQGILGSHPRLGAKKVDSAQSQAEQAQLRGSSEETEQLRVLNEEYEKAFPGLRYVVFVNGRSRPVIMEDMKNRIKSSNLKSEQTAAIRVSTVRARV